MKKKTAALLNSHARLRSAQRYGVALTKKLRRQLLQQIREQNAAKFLKRQSRTRTHWLITLGDKPAVVVYDKTRHTIVTVLPECCVPPAPPLSE